MGDFPRTTVGGVEISRMVIGTNWLLGFTHCTRSKSDYVKQHVRDNRKVLTDILEVFFSAGVDSIISMQGFDALDDAIHEAEDRTGVECKIISTPIFRPHTPEMAEKGFDEKAVDEILDAVVERGSVYCLPHVDTTDRMLDKCTRKIRHFDWLCAKMRERDLIPGLSTHTPEAIVYADETDLDVETYISIYNSAGFLMHHEVDWTQRIIQNAKKPVLTIKPMAAGQLRPLQGLTFVWNTIRECDMVSVGTMSPDEAKEVIEMSLSILENRPSTGDLQERDPKPG